MGTETPNVENTMTTLSRIDPGFFAENTPNGIAMTKVTIIDIPAKLKVTAKRSTIISITGFLKNTEVPKSP